MLWSLLCPLQVEHRWQVNIWPVSYVLYDVNAKHALHAVLWPLQVEHIWPMNYLLRPWAMGEEFFWETKKGVLSYVIFRPLMTLVSVISNLTGGYCTGLALETALGTLLSTFGGIS